MDHPPPEHASKDKDELDALMKASHEYEQYLRLAEAAGAVVAGEPPQKQPDWSHPMGLVITGEQR